ncbi:MAG: sulfite exporter TauE/SafE family protein [Chromatiales bacterium]|nr:sulfite exporter TauE/SafE family protein [Chromatiales bacterium]
MSDPAGLALLLLVMTATGLGAGIIAGLLGVGGGIVVVPVLYHVLGLLDVDITVRMHIAVGTSLATIIPTSIRSLRAHGKRGSFDEQLFRTWAPGLVCGGLAGAAIAGLAEFRLLVSVFAVVAGLVALQMAFGLPERPQLLQVTGRVAGSLLGGLTGMLSAMMGIGGGTLAVPLLSLGGVPIHRAVGTSAGFGLLIAVPATAGFILSGWQQEALPPLSFGYVNLAGVLVIIPASLLTVPFGVRLAHTLRQQTLRRAFAVFLGLTAARMLSDAIGLHG